MTVGDDTLVGQVMTQGLRAADWLKAIAQSDVVMLIPEGDPLGSRFGNKYKTFEGPEDDVLGRYFLAAERYQPDYIVRLTGDCAWMTSQMIAKCVRDCFKYDADYCSNVLVRTFMEGLDVEVISAPLLRELQLTQHDMFHREHVTSAIPDLLAEKKLSQYKIHTVLSDYDMSFIKTSIDTAEEYEACNNLFLRRKEKKNAAMSFGSISN
jgi:spore coat polysaccharide biosynthesis protein SpsF (cytidylyltransferase family)